MGAPRRGSCAKPCRSHGGRASRGLADLGPIRVCAGHGRPGHLGHAIRTARRGARGGRARACVGRARTRAGLGCTRGTACGRRNTRWSPAGSRLGRCPAARISATAAPGLRSAALPAGLRTAAGRFRTAPGCARLGRAGSRPRLGRASSSRAAGAAAPRSDGRAATTATCGGATGADLGIAAGRVRAGRCRRCLGAPSRAVVGRSATGRPGSRPSRHRLGITAGERPAPGATGSVVERAGRPSVVGRPQDRGTRSAGCPVMGCASARPRLDASG